MHNNLLCTVATAASPRSRAAPNGGYLRAACRLAATVRDGSPGAVTDGRSRHGEHPGARVSMAATLRILHQSLSQA